VTHLSHDPTRPSLLAFIARVTTYRPGHTLLRFGMNLFDSNQALLIGLRSKAYFDALD